MDKYLGQHFLKNKNKIKKIVEALDLKPNDVVIEIGAGHGEITDQLRIKNYELRGGLKIIIIEKDRRLAQFLKQKFQSQTTLSYRKARKAATGRKNESKNENVRGIEIIEGDALKEIKNQISKKTLWGFFENKITNQKSKITENLKIVGNIPYYITGYLLRVLAELERKPSLIVLTIQKEVAQRIIAESPRMNLLAASVQFWAEPEIIGYISKKDFRPVPKVNSAIIKFNIRRFDLPKLSSILKRSNLQEIKNKYYKFIRILFKQPRKTILNNLINAELRRNLRGTTQKKEEVIQKLHQIGINPSNRPQNLNIEQILKLSTLF